MSSPTREANRFYPTFQPSVYSTGLQPFRQHQPTVYQGLFDDEDLTHEERLGEKAGSMAGLLAGLAANSKVPWLKDRFVLSRVFFVFATAGLGREIGKYIGKKAGGE